MFAPRWSGSLGRLVLPQVHVRAGEAARSWTCRAGRSRPYGSEGGQRPPGVEPGVHPPGLARQTLREWTLPVSPFGQLRARLPCHLSLSPLDPLTYPDGDRVLVTVSGGEGGESDLTGLQSQKLNVQTKGGNVTCLGTIYGDIDIHASKKSIVTVDKLQGSSVNISTENGLLKARYLYTESSFLSSTTGDISLGSVHGNITVKSSMGNITVDSSSGCLEALTHQGAIDVYVSQLGKVELKSHTGSILVKVASSLQAHLQLSAKEVDVNSEIHIQEMDEVHKDDGITVTGQMNQANKHEKWIKADAPKGTINFRSQSWFQSLKLQD
ncbi:protein FAM185A isoform X1 [Erinaceus europaeus]|uniref:Protein FAM185A isoform X1 n=1 Tax=Erinaceus europaeus TaxID=9365 RepID=A0ABM3XU52_ERIEU|nr:protein FAM185A isoform X1 [Erinaceus europaeus]